MSKDSIIPSADDIIGPGIDQLVSLRPSALPFVNYGKGRYANVFEGWRAQINLLIRRLADEVKSARLPLAQADSLLSLAASEYFASFTTSASPALGEVKLARSTGTLPSGVIRAGQKFQRTGNHDAQPVPKADMTYAVTSDVVVAQGQTTGIIVPISATRTGVDGNVVRGRETGAYTSAPPTAMLDIQPSTALFDSALLVTDCFAAGGSDGGIDKGTIRHAAQSIYAAQYAPADAALLGGALEVPGVARAAVLEDSSSGRSVVLVADRSWATSATLQASVLSHLVDDQKPYIGFGLSAVVGGVYNVFIHVDATVMLADAKYVPDEQDIAEKIGAALTQYFDDKPDFWRWDASSVAASVTRASRKVRACTAVTVRSALDGTVLSDPGAPDLSGAAASGVMLPHFYLPDNAVSLTFEVPT